MLILNTVSSQHGCRCYITVTENQQKQDGIYTDEIDLRVYCFDGIILLPRPSGYTNLGVGECNVRDVPGTAQQSRYMSLGLRWDGPSRASVAFVAFASWNKLFLRAQGRDLAA